MTESSLRVTDNESKAVQKTKNRVSLDSIESKIVRVQYIHPVCALHFTIAVVLLDNGYIVTGESAPADPENFDSELGRKFAYEAAIRKIWPLEGYRLCQNLKDVA